MNKKVFFTALLLLFFGVNINAKADFYEDYNPNANNYDSPSFSSPSSTDDSLNQGYTAPQTSVYGFSPAPPPMHGPKPVTNTYSAPSYNYNTNTATTNSYTQNYSSNTPSYSAPVSTPKAVSKPVAAAKPKEVRDYVYTPNSTNSSVKYYYYIPATLVNSTKPYPLVVYVPGLDGDGEEASGMIRDLADKKGYAILAPTFKFNDNDFKQQKSYQYPQAWSGAALVNMLEQAKASGLNYSKLYLLGFSAGAQFSSRFSFMKPELIDACALLSSGARVKPDKNNGVRYFIGIGTSDDEYRLQNAEIFNNAAQALNIPIVYNKYNMGHDLSDEEMSDVFEFFDKVRNGSI